MAEFTKEQFKNSVAMQIGFVCFSDLEVGKAVEHICLNAEKSMEAESERLQRNLESASDLYHEIGAEILDVRSINADLLAACEQVLKAFPMSTTLAQTDAIIAIHAAIKKAKANNSVEKGG